MNVEGFTRLFKRSGAFIVLSIGISCVPDNILDFPETQNYYPLRVGDYRVYTVAETQIAAFNIETQSTYEVKTLVTDSFQNVEGGYSFIVARFKRSSSTEAWSSLDTWTARSNSNGVVISEGNVQYLKVSYPVDSGKTWNGNEYNNQEDGEICSSGSGNSDDLYAYGAVQSPFKTSGGLVFENTSEVIENNFPDIFSRQDIRKAVYALDVGMVYREINIKKYCTEISCYNKQLVECGRLLKMELKEYGRE